MQFINFLLGLVFFQDTVSPNIAISGNGFPEHAYKWDWGSRNIIGLTMMVVVVMVLVVVALAAAMLMTILIESFEYFVFSQC